MPTKNAMIDTFKSELLRITGGLQGITETDCEHYAIEMAHRISFDKEAYPDVLSGLEAMDDNLGAQGYHGAYQVAVDVQSARKITMTMMVPDKDGYPKRPVQK